MTEKPAPQAVGSLERLLLRLDEPPMDAIYRVVVGFLYLPALTAVAPDAVYDWRLLAGFAALLVGLRVIPAVLRKLLPFSNAVLATWNERRQVAKRFDSYQWQKLFWIGLGLASYVGLRGAFARSSVALTAACLAAGMLGLLRWRTRRAQAGQ